MEEWRKIPGTPERFEASSQGRVRTLAYALTRLKRGGGSYTQNMPERLLTPYANSARGGYLQCTAVFTKDGARQVISLKVHRLVAEVFLPNTLDLPEVNHKDSVKGNCCVQNLEWVTKSENNLHSYRSGLRKQHALTLPIVGVSATETVRFPSLLAAKNSGRFHMSSISQCLLGKAKQHKGFTWSKDTAC